MTEQNNSTQWADPTPKTKAKGKGPLYGLIAFLLVAAVGIGIYASGILGGKGGNEKEQVSQALLSIFKGEENPFMEEWLGTGQLTENMVKASKMSGRLELVEAPIVTEMTGFPIPGGIMLSFEASQASDAKASSGSLGLGMMGTEIVNGKFYMNDTKLQAAAPALFQEVLTADYSGDLEAKLKNAPLFKDQMTDPEALAGVRQFTEALQSGREQQEKMMKFMTGETGLADYPGLKEHTDTFKDKWVIVKADDRKQTWNGQEGSFKGYQVTMPKQAFVEYLRNLKTYLMTDEKVREDILDVVLSQMAAQESITPEEAKTKLDGQMTEWITQLEANPEVKDMVFTVHMTEDNELVSLKTEHASADGTMKLDFERHGGAYPDENMKLSLSADGAKAGTMEITSTGKTEGMTQERELHITATQADAQSMDQVMTTTMNRESGLFSAKVNGSVTQGQETIPILVTMTGKLQDIVKGKSGKLVMDELKLVTEGQTLAILKGEMSYATENITVTELEGTQLDLMTATPQDMEKVNQQIQDKLGILFQLMGSPLGF